MNSVNDNRLHTKTCVTDIQCNRMRHDYTLPDGNLVFQHLRYGTRMCKMNRMNIINLKHNILSLGTKLINGNVSKAAVLSVSRFF